VITLLNVNRLSQFLHRLKEVGFGENLILFPMLQKYWKSVNIW